MSREHVDHLVEIHINAISGKSINQSIYLSMSREHVDHLVEIHINAISGKPINQSDNQSINQSISFILWVKSASLSCCR